MESPSQNASFRRKLIYFGVIAVLFAVSLVARGVVAMPGMDNTLGKWTMRQQSDRLELTEMAQGKVQLSDSAIRLMLTGSRGLAVCALWISAHENQKNEEWAFLERDVNNIITLQPHFVLPWLFQSWNFTYNVSVEMDRLGDMYFYIARGINLLAEGEEVNRYNPDIRYALAFYYQNKFYVSDKVTTLRCLFQLSCIPKEKRDYRKLLKGGQIDMEGGFKEFVEQNPVLVRRLRETEIQYGKNRKGETLTMYLAPKPSEVVDFLKENELLPNRYRDDAPGDLAERLSQFPVVPAPDFYRDPEEEMNPQRPVGDGQANGLRAARVWFRYANESIPPPTKEMGPTPTDYRDPERKRRVPKAPMLIIFRQGPPRAQTYIAENLAKEGWIDRSTWSVDSENKEAWFKETVLVTPTANSQEEWEKAYSMWYNHIEENGFLLDDNPEKLRLELLAKRYARQRGIQEGAPVPPPRPEDEADPEMMLSARAAGILRFNGLYRGVTNCETFLHQAAFEKDPRTIEARKILFEADAARRSERIDAAIKLYESVLGTQKNPGKWGQILRERRRSADALLKGDQILEETYEHQIRYLNLVRENKKADLRRATLTLFDIARATNPMQTSPGYLATSDLILNMNSGVLTLVEPLPPPGPFDGVDPDGREWIPDNLKDRVRQTMGLNKPSQPQSPPPSQQPPSGGN